MTKPRRTRNRAITAAIAAGALLIGGAVVALAAQPDKPIISGPNGFISDTTPSFALADADGLTNVNGAGTFLYDFDGTPSIPLAAPGPVPPPAALGQGPHTFQALEVGTPDPDSAIATQSFFVDTVNPTFSRTVGPSSPNGLAGWYTGSVTVNYTCTDPGGANASGLTGPCPTDLALNVATEDGVYVLATGPVVDQAGNSSGPALAEITVKRDSTDPAKPTLAEPLAISNVLNPTFTWSEVEDETPQGVTQISGLKEYVLTIRQGSTGGSVVHQTTVIPGAGTQASYAAVPNLTNGTTYNWRVEAVDNAGNSVLSDAGVFQVDTTAPDDPTFSAGPTNGQATNDNTPTFSFTGVPGATFTWETRNGLDELVTGVGFAGTGPQSSVTLPTLPDGTYTFKVKQTAPNNKVSGFGSALFTVDTTAPTAPSITSSPGTTGNTQPSFGWSASEQDGTFVWEVTGVGGARVQGPGDASSAAVQLSSPLSPGNYAFRVRQRDRAGNLSDWSAPEPFTIVTQPGTGSGNPNDPGTGVSRFKPSTRNAKALLPKVGSKVRPAKATLRWKRAKGATLYNVQVFRIDGSTYRKVHSAFPRGLRYTVPKRVLKANKRYVWRVWPYVGAKKRYTPAPLGISWFDTP